MLNLLNTIRSYLFHTIINIRWKYVLSVRLQCTVPTSTACTSAQNSIYKCTVWYSACQYSIYKCTVQYSTCQNSMYNFTVQYLPVQHVQFYSTVPASTAYTSLQYSPCQYSIYKFTVQYSTCQYSMLNPIIPLGTPVPAAAMPCSQVLSAMAAQVTAISPSSKWTPHLKGIL